MLTTIVRAACILILTAFVVGVGSLARNAHLRGRDRLRRHRVRHLDLDGYADWLAAMDRRRRDGGAR